MYEPIYTDSQNLKLKTKYGAISCDTKNKFCMFNTSNTFLCYYKTVNDIEYFGNCYVIGEVVNAS